MEVMLEVKKLTKYFGGLAAIDGLDLQVNRAEILGLIGPNGAGKTTMFNAISGLFRPTSGQVIFEGMDITGWEAHEIAQIGISRNFQATTLFMGLSVMDNIFTGYHMSYKTSIWKRVFRTPSALKEEGTFRHRATEILAFMGLGATKDELAENISYGNQRILGVCMALAANPKLLLLDEPVTGMNTAETQTMIKLIRQIRDSRGVTIVVVEHDMRAVMSLCDRIVALNYGRKIAEGLPKEIMENKDVIEAYLGEEET